MTAGRSVPVTSELTLVATPHGVELQREGKATTSLFDYAEVATWAQRRQRTTIERHMWWCFLQGRARCAKCGVVHFGAMFEVCA